MKESFEKYIKNISEKYKHIETSEMGYRTDFELLLKDIFQSIDVGRIDHDAKAKEGNKPDFVIIKNDIPILYIEVKDIGVSLDKIEKSEQMARYFGYANLVLTDYVEFRFYRNGILYEEPISIAEISKKDRTLSPNPQNFERVSKTLIDFTLSHKEPIKNGSHLAKVMGGKAQRIRDNVLELLNNKEKKEDEIFRVYETIKDLLVHDLTLENFSDMYAQTLVYGLFAARYHDETQEDFSRQEARDLVPGSNPFLQHFFDHIVGPNFEKRLEFIVNELCEVFSHADVKELMEQYYGTDLWGEKHDGPDPVIHFYEDFLQEYDADLRKKMGAYYTPTPVVRFIVRSIDEILQGKFNISQGLADKSKNSDGVHKVQVLDPAVGTGTFISAVIRKIYERLVENKQEGTWTSYVHNDLLPRLHGFELMMAPYTVAHLKLSAAFKKTGFKYFNKTRLGIYLTNSLEPAEIKDDLFGAFGLSQSISEESKEAAKIKNEKPIMVVVGNPPYSGVSSNETEYANGLVEKYKVEPGGTEKLKERKHWLNDDYVKFISFAESQIAQTGEGVMGMITAHGYLDNPTFRGMRWHLMKTFSEIYVLDLHGNANKKETTPDGEKDENVFNIKTGVSIILALKKSDDNNGLAKVYRGDLYGKKRSKLTALKDSSWANFEWKEIKPQDPHYYFDSFDYEAEKKYKESISVAELFPVNVTGIVTMGDGFAITDTKEEIFDRLYELKMNQPTEAGFKTKFGLGKNYGKWLLNNIKSLELSENKIVPISYRPFDVKWTYFDNKVIWRWREEVMKNFLESNIGIVIQRQSTDDFYNHISITNFMIDNRYHFSGKGIPVEMPLYLYSDLDEKTKIKSPNINKEILLKIEKIAGEIKPEDILDYVYATLHSPSYREKYKEFLKIDFPRVPYPENKDIFWKFVEKGAELKDLHLMKAGVLNNPITSFNIEGSNIIEKIIYKNGNVWINENQYFGDVPEIAWNFYIGGYQPAQKWLKDRKGRTLTNEDIEHWQKIIVALSETDRIMKEIDKIIKF